MVRPITWSSWWVCILVQIPIKQQDMPHIPTQVTSTDEPESQKHWGVIRIWAGPPALGRLRKCPWFCWSWTYKGMWLGDSLPLAGSLNKLPTGVLRSNCLFDWVGIPLRAKSRKPTWWDNSLKTFPLFWVFPTPRSTGPSCACTPEAGLGTDIHACWGRSWGPASQCPLDLLLWPCCHGCSRVDAVIILC